MLDSVCLYCCLLTLILSLSIYVLYRITSSQSEIDPHGKYVLISGCDSGFGHDLAIKLDRKGFSVLAGVYMIENVKLLQNKLSSSATVFRLDITRQEDIDTAYELVQQKTNILHALVNNAGVATGGYIDWVPLETTKRMMEVNFFGHVAVTKKLLPLLIAKKNSRVVNMSSMCGFIGLPGSGAYCASKFALESFSDCLRREMAPWNLHVSIIEPGTMRTAMTENLEESLRDVWYQLPTDVRTRWGERCFEHLFKLVMHSPFIKYSESPVKVIRVLEHAITSTSPRIRYRPGWQSSLIFYPLSLLPANVTDRLFSLGFDVHPDGIQHQFTN